MGNYVIAGVRNYVIENPSNLGNFMIADIPDPVIDEAVDAITKDRSIMDRVRANREVYNLLRDGYRAEWTKERGDKRIETLRYLDLRPRQ